jgi:hypothetical protein
LARGIVAFPDLGESAATAPIPVLDDELFDQAAFAATGATGAAGGAGDVPSATGADDPGENDHEAEADSSDAPLPLHLAQQEPSAEEPAAEKKPLGEKKARRAPRRSPRVTNLGVAGREGDARNARPEVPSWDDILLGVRRKQD